MRKLPESASDAAQVSCSVWRATSNALTQATSFRLAANERMKRKKRVE